MAAKYDEQALADFLVELSFTSLTLLVMQTPHKISARFGCTLLTASKWLNRIEDNRVIEKHHTGNYFIRVVADAEKAKQQRMVAVREGVESGKVVRFGSFKVRKNKGKK